MHLLLILVMAVSVSAAGCPSECRCQQGEISCAGGTNVTYENFPATTTSIALRGVSLQYATDFLNAMSSNGSHLPLLAHLTVTDATSFAYANVTFDLPGLRSFRLSNVGLLQTPSLNMSNLRVLDLSRNALRVMDRSPFRTLVKLEVLDLSENSIDRVSSDGFKGLAALQRLDISGNNLSTLDGQMFMSLASLQQLNLSRNNLEVLDEMCFSSLQRLQQLDMSWNKLARVNPGTLQLPSLARLLLAGNPALGASPEPTLLVSTGRRLQTVDVSRTGLVQVPAALTHSVRTLRLAGNAIRTVSCGDLDSYPLLQLLDFTSNALEEIEEDALGRLDMLSILYLSDNKLRHVPLSLPDRLRIVHLERNRIEQIASADLQGLTRLEVLLLNDNNIKVVQARAFTHLSSLASLDLSRNPIVCLPAGALSGPTELQVLRLAGLGQLVQPKDDGFPILTPEYLVTLDLSNSPELARQLLADTATLAAFRELQELDMNDCNLQDIRSDLRHFLPQLRVLHIINNPLNCTELIWLASWMRRQDQLEYRLVTCAAPPDVAGTLLIDLQGEEPIIHETTILPTSTMRTRKPSTQIKAIRNGTIASIIARGVVREEKNKTLTSPIFTKAINTTFRYSTKKINGNKLNVDFYRQNKQKSLNLTTTTMTTAATTTTASTVSTVPTTIVKSKTNNSESERLVEPSSTTSAKPRTLINGTQQYGNYVRKAIDVSNEVSNNIFIGSKGKLTDNNSPLMENQSGSKPIGPSTPSTLNRSGDSVNTKRVSNLSLDFVNVTDDGANGVTLSAGEMSMYSSSGEEDSQLTHPGMLVLAVGILLSVTALGTLASRVSRRRRAEFYSRQQDIEVSSITGVGELW